MNAAALCIGQFIAATDFGIPGVINDKEPTFTIGECARVSMADMKNVGKEIEKGIVYFSDYSRGWVMNKTNLQCLTAMFGDNTSMWAGKRVTLCAPMVDVGREKKLGIRIKGSPDLSAPMQVTVKLPKKKPISMTMEATGRRQAPATPYEGFASAVRQNFGINPASVAEWAKETSGLDLLTASEADLRAFYRRIEKGGADRAAFDSSPFAG